MKSLRTLGREERGQEITEFAMISALVALFLLAGTGQSRLNLSAVEAGAVGNRDPRPL